MRKELKESIRKIGKIGKMDFQMQLFNESSCFKLEIFKNLYFDNHESHAPISVKKIEF